MTYLSGTAFAADFFRVSYQSAEAAFNGPVAPPQPSVSERIGRIIQIQIAVFDAFFTIGHYAGTINGLERFKDVIVPLRLAAIIQGVYQLINDPNADRGSIHRSIFLNALNVGCSALRVLKQGMANPSVHAYLDYAALACTFSDALYRIGLTYSQRTEIANKLSAIYQGVKNGVTNVASTIDHYAGYPLRVIVTGVIAFELFRSGAIALQNATKADSRTFAAALLVGALGCGLVKLTQITAHKLFDAMGVQDDIKRQIAEWSLSVIVGGSFAAATAVGYGLAESIPAIFKAAYPAIVMLALMSIVPIMAWVSMDEMFNQLGVQNSIVRFVVPPSIAGCFICILNDAIAVGFGLAKTLDEAHLLGAFVFDVFISIMSISAAAGLIGITNHFGPPDWEALSMIGIAFLTLRFMVWATMQR